MLDARFGLWDKTGDDAGKVGGGSLPKASTGAPLAPETGEDACSDACEDGLKENLKENLKDANPKESSLPTEEAAASSLLLSNDLIFDLA